MAIDKDIKHTAVFRTERRKGLYVDPPPPRQEMRWGLMLAIAAALAVPIVLIVWLVKILVGGP